MAVIRALQVAARSHPSIPYVAPFALFLAFLALDRHLSPTWRPGYPVRVVAVSLTLLLFSRSVISLRPSRVFSSVWLGLAVFAIWIAPDLLWPGYRGHWLFRNPVTGEFHSSAPAAGDWVFTLFRLAGAVIVVPIIEELFWRGWLMRCLIAHDFRAVPLGAYAAPAFWVTTVLFAAEHGPYWDVGLLAGAAYNLWMIRTRSLADCILAHAVTNGALGAYVLSTGKWEYWM